MGIKRIVFVVPSIMVSLSYAQDNAPFQQFDNQYDAGFRLSQTDFANGAQQHTLEQDQYLTINVERLFDMGIWLNGTGDIVVNSNNLDNQATGSGQGTTGSAPGALGNVLTQSFNQGGVNLKGGYAFTVANQHLQLIPYAQIGINTNLAQSVVQSNNYKHVTSDMFYSGGLGGRIEYRINNAVLVYADQDDLYNWDQSGPVNGIQPQNNMILTSTLGAKFNVVKNLQLGVNGFYSNYQYLAAVPPASVIGPNGGNRNGTLTTIYQPQSTVGGLVSIGLTY